MPVNPRTPGFGRRVRAPNVPFGIYIQVVGGEEIERALIVAKAESTREFSKQLRKAGNIIIQEVQKNIKGARFRAYFMGKSQPFVSQKTEVTIKRGRRKGQKVMRFRPTGKLSSKTLGIFSGHLRKSIGNPSRDGIYKRKVSRRNGTINGYLVVGTKVRYARIHEFGGKIRPRKKKTLRFFDYRTGQWVYTRLVRMPKRPYFFPGVRRALPKVSRVFEKVLRVI